MLTINLLLFILSITVILVCSHFFVHYACLLGKHLNWGDTLVGVLILGVSTSIPEIMISLYSHLSDHEGLFLGNILGSNIANSSLILGIALLCSHKAILPFSDYLKPYLYMMIISVLLVIMIALQAITFLYAAILVVLSIIGLYKKSHISHQKKPESERSKVILVGYIVIIVFLVGLIFAGAQFTVNIGLKVADIIRLPESAFGALFIAVATSLPEIAVAAMAAMQKKIELVFSTVLGSNIANIGFAIGLSALIKPIMMSAYDILPMAIIMLAASALIAVWMKTNAHWHVVKGMLLLLLYLTFILWIIR